MNRRSLLSNLGKAAAAATLSPSLLSALPLPSSTRTTASTEAELANGSSSLRFVKGPSGLGLELSIRRGGVRKRIASVQNPVSIFYEKRGEERNLDVEFSSVLPVANGLVTSIEHTDPHRNRWLIRLEVSKWNTRGFRCDFQYRLLDGRAQDVFFEHGLVPDLASSPDETYVLMPGQLYDGNRLAHPDGEVPRLNSSDRTLVDIPALSLSTPATLLYEKATGNTLATMTEVESGLGPSGFSYEMHSQQHKLAVMAPLYREQHFHGHVYEPCTPAGANLVAGQSFRVTVFHLPTHYASLEEFYSAFRALREPAPFVRTPGCPMSKAAELVEKNFNDIDWCKGGDYYINASPPDYDPVTKGCESLPIDWHLITGWCAGAITGYALLKTGDEQSRQRSREMFDLIASGGISPSGLFWSNYRKGHWDTGNAQIAMNQHMRMPADATFFFLKAIALEKGQSIEHPEWIRAAVSNLDAFAKLWRENRDFGHFVNRETLKIERSGSAAGALCIGALALGAGLQNGKEYLDVAREAADAYFHRYVETGWLAGGPLDIGISSDSESATAMVESFVTLYEADRNPNYLRYAQMAGDILMSWVVSYNAPFPAGTDCARAGIQTVGGVLANSRNHHIGPSAATSSCDMFMRLYRYTGETAYLRVLGNIVSGLPQYLCYAPGRFPEMQVGMMSEQYNMTDELGTRGHVWHVNASWGATCLLLSYGALPSIYVDRTRRVVAVFDQLSASADFDAQKLKVTNATPHEARISIGTETEQGTKIVLASGQSQTISLATMEAMD